MRVTETRTAATRRWLFIHKWTSLICTVVLLLACLTGLPMIFHHEIDEWTGRAPHMEEGVPTTAPLDRIVADGLAARPGEVAQLLFFDGPNLARFRTAPQPTSIIDESFSRFVDLRSGKPVDVKPPQEGVMWMVVKLHTDLYMGLLGMFILGAMGVLVVGSIVSGIMVYRPFMRRLPFGTIRNERGRRLRWLDLHNLLGITIFSWVLVVGFTGAINSMAVPMLNVWQSGQLAEMTAPYRTAPPLGKERASIDIALKAAKDAAPGMKPFIIAFPGTTLSTDHHYAIFMRGDAPHTSRILTPALIDARTGELTGMRNMPWYFQVLFLSQPLHFGDYGGDVMRVIWALLDVVTIIVLGSGLYLWVARFGRRRTTPSDRKEKIAHASQV